MGLLYSAMTYYCGFTPNIKYFEYLRGERMVGEAFEELFGGPVRQPESPISQRECDLAASIQKVTEEVVLGLATAVVKQTGQRCAQPLRAF